MWMWSQLDRCLSPERCGVSGGGLEEDESDIWTDVDGVCRRLLSLSEYQLESDSLSQCELLRSVAVAKQQGDIPHCSEDGRFRYEQPADVYLHLDH